MQFKFALKGAVPARCLVSLVLTCLAGALFTTAAAEQSGGDHELAASIVQKADAVRFPTEAFEASVSIESAGSDEARAVRRYRVLSKGNDNTIVQIVEPAAERGQIMLMKGHDLWVFLPNVSQPVRFSLSQRLTGQVANGDIARANFAGDYEPLLLRTERLEGDEAYVLELTARERGVTYQRVLYWVRKSNLWPIKAEFYAVSGRMLKTCTYEEFKMMAGRVRPTRLVMQDALKPEERSVMAYSDMRHRDLPDRMFTKDYLKRLE